MEHWEPCRAVVRRAKGRSRIWRVQLTTMLEVLAQAMVKGRRGVIQLCYEAEDSLSECDGVEQEEQTPKD